MERRSTNVVGFTHYSGDVTAQVGSSHGVRLSGGSTGGIVEAVGDDTNVSLTLRGQGTGRVIVGNSSQSVFLGGSTSPLANYVVVTSTTVVPADASTEVRQILSTMTAAGVTTNATIAVSERTLGSDTTLFLLSAVCSTANEIVLSWLKPHKLASTESTRSVRIAAFQ